MKYYTIKKLNNAWVTIAFGMMLVGAIQAQTGLNSFYSRFGLGDPVNNHFMDLRSMGSIGAAYNDPYQINIANPASLAHLRAVSFDLGVNIRLANISDGTTSQGIESGHLDYVSIALPLINKVNEILEREERDYNITTAFTLMPHTRVGYDISSAEETEEFGTIVRNFKGEGGTYKFLWGNSVRYKDVSFGLNLGYLFGKLSYERNVFFQQSEFAFDTEFLNEFSNSGFLWNAGVQYSMVFNKNEMENQIGIAPKMFVLGAHYGSNTGFSTESEILEISSQSRTGLRDTLRTVRDIPGEGTLPGEFGIGALYRSGEKFAIGVNYLTTQWSAFKNDARPEELSDASTISIGGYYRPNYLSQRGFWDRVYYRMGAFYTKDARSVNGENLKTYGVTMGLGLPFIYQRRISHANLGLELGRRGQGSIIEESFVKINIGFTFNDTEWFLKRRYD